MHGNTHTCDSEPKSQPLCGTTKPGSPMFYFESFHDFGTTVMRITPMTLAVSIVGALISLITNYLYHDLNTVILIGALFASDLVSGIYASYRERVDKNEAKPGLKSFIKTFKSSKFMRSPIAFLFHMMLLSLAWHGSKVQPVLGFLPGLIVGTIFVTQFISVSENMYAAKVIGSRMFNAIMDAVNLKSLLGKKKGGEPNS